MSQSDTISDLLAAIRNASQAKKPQVDIPGSRFGSAILECLKAEGFIQNWRLMKEGNPQGVLRVYLKYTKDRRPILRHIRRVSKPGLRIYVPKTKIPKILSGIGMSILSTPHGVLSDKEARAQGVGGEMLCHVW